MKQISDVILSDILDRLEAGEPVERFLAQYSEQADELQSFLETADQIRRLPSQPLPEARQRSKKAFLFQAATLQKSQVQKGWFPWSIWPRLLRPVASLAVLFVIFGIMFVSASASALPGDTLYGTKRAVEHWRLLLASSPEAASDLEESFHQERISEIEQLLHSGRSSDVSFKGIITYMSDQQWIVAKLPLVIDETTIIVGIPVIGENVQVNGHTRDGILYADQITILTDKENAPQPTIMPPASPSPTVTIVTPTTVDGMEEDDDGNDDDDDGNDDDDDGNDDDGDEGDDEYDDGDDEYDDGDDEYDDGEDKYDDGDDE